MAKQLLQFNRNLPFLSQIHRLSSFNNNRSKSGIISLIANEDLNIWSDKNWSACAKLFTKSVDFPLPGQVGVIFEFQKRDIGIGAETDSELRNNLKVAYENYKYIVSKPSSREDFIQMMKLNESAIGSLGQVEKALYTDEGTDVTKKFELKAFKCPKTLQSDFQTYFRKSFGDSPVTVITISFKTENDMATWNSDVDDEREVLIKKFVETAKSLCKVLEKEGFWADFIDPSTGRPFKSEYSYATFFETDERYRQLGFEIADQGCCKVVSHHSWGTKAYVGCLLTNASLEGKSITNMTSAFTS